MAEQKNNQSSTHAEIDVLRKRVAKLEAELNEVEQIRQQLLEEQSFRDSVIGQAAEGICACHEIPEFPFVQFTLWNPRMDEITGYSMEQINRLGWYQSIYPDSEIQELARQRMAAMRNGEDLLYERWEITRADGNKRTLGITTSRLITHDGQSHVLALMQDITDMEGVTELRQAKKILDKTLIKLEKEVQKRAKAEKRLLKANKTLEQKVKNRTTVLEETNAALKIILNQREKDKEELADSIMSNLNDLVLPYLHQLGQTKINAKQKAVLEILKANLAQVIQPFAIHLTSKHFNLTPMEMRVADLIRNGQSNKEIAEILGVSLNTILTHRYHIRKKLNLKNKKINLRSFLKAL